MQEGGGVPKDFCKAACTAIIEQKVCDEGHQDLGYTSRGKYYDETSGEELDGTKVWEARQLEYFDKMGVFKM